MTWWWPANSRTTSKNTRNYLSYTAWYAVARNRLARASYVALLEYDVSVSVDFKRATIQALSDSHAIIRVRT